MFICMNIKLFKICIYIPINFFIFTYPFISLFLKFFLIYKFTLYKLNCICTNFFPIYNIIIASYYIPLNQEINQNETSILTSLPHQE